MFAHGFRLCGHTDKNCVESVRYGPGAALKEKPKGTRQMPRPLRSRGEIISS